jgi:hypothetical protein
MTIGVIAASEHTVCEDGVDTPRASGLTVTVAVKSLPTQPAVVGVIVKVTVWEISVTLFRDPEILPVPDADMPVTFVVLSLVQA